MKRNYDMGKTKLTKIQDGQIRVVIGKYKL